MDLSNKKSSIIRHFLGVARIYKHSQRGVNGKILSTVIRTRKDTIFSSVEGKNIY